MHAKGKINDPLRVGAIEVALGLKHTGPTMAADPFPKSLPALLVVVLETLGLDHFLDVLIIKSMAGLP